ncbi:hypothetical protein ACIPF8_17450 [Collimonas sp. NPDC087041]|uniref:hypothetical protein n=1 Tax=Collimonas sp. NPDC087041 TaxID=3363960 RepID=UPI0037FCDDBF
MNRVIPLLLMLSAGFFSMPVMAQNSYAGLNHINNIVNGVSGKVVTNAVGNGVVATASGDVLVTASGLRVSVPVSVAASADAATVAASAARLVPWAAAAVTAGQVAVALKNAGYRYGSCANPGIIVGPATSYCKPVAPQDVYLWSDTKGNTFSSLDAACQSQAVISTVSPNDYPITNDGTACWAGRTGNRYVFAYPNSVVNPNPAPPTYSPATGDDIAGALKLQEIADSNLAKRLYDAMKQDMASNPGLQNEDTNPIKQTTPVTVTAPPVTSPVSEPSIQTIQNPDGTTSTQRTTQQVTVTPTTTGTTVGDSQTTFPSKTTTVTTTTNNTTNVTTTNTSTTVNPLPTQFPDDYNREVTQKQIEKDLNTDAAPVLPDQQKVITDAGTQADSDRQKIYDGITSGQQDKSSWFSWVWSPPVGVCTAFTGVVAGFTITWDFCQYIYILRDVLGWLLALFSAYLVYGQLFRRED